MAPWVNEDQRLVATGLDAFHRSYPDVQVINVWTKAGPRGDTFPQVFGGYEHYRTWRSAFALPVCRDPEGVQQDIYRVGSLISFGQQTKVLTEPCQAEAVVSVASMGMWEGPQCG